MSFEKAQAAWDLAEFTDGVSQLGKPVLTGDLLVPNTVNLSVGKDHLVWVPEDGSKRVKPAMESMFNGFVRLWQEPPSAVLQFARDWGVLYLDPEGTPGIKRYSLNRPTPPSRSGPLDEARLSEMQSEVLNAWKRSEPLDAWKYFSHRAFATLAIAASLKQGKRASPSDWEFLDGLDGRIGSEALRDLGDRRGLLELYARVGCPYSAGWDLDKERRWLVREIMLWLEIGRPGYAVSEQSWKLEVDYNGCLFTAIALQLALTVTGERNLFTCSGCGQPSVRQSKAPKQGQDNYCAQCGPHAALRAANARVRVKRAEARRMRAAGMAMREIAEKLNVRSTKRSTALRTVRRWIGEG